MTTISYHVWIKQGVCTILAQDLYVFLNIPRITHSVYFCAAEESQESKPSVAVNTSCSLNSTNAHMTVTLKLGSISYSLLQPLNVDVVDSLYFMHWYIIYFISVHFLSLSTRVRVKMANSCSITSVRSPAH